MALRTRLSERVRGSLREQDLGKAGSAFALAVLTVLASVVAALQGNASIEAGRANRAAEEIGAAATGQDVSQVIQIGAAYGVYRRWYEELERAAWASFERAKATSDEDKAVFDALQQADNAIAEWIRSQSPLLQPPYFDPATRTSDFGGFEADHLIGRSIAAAQHRDAEAAVAAAWGTKAAEYVTVLTLVAVGLFFVGLAATLSGTARRFLGGAGLTFGLVAIAWTLIVHQRPVHRIPDSAIDHLVASHVALARAPLAAGTGGLTAADVSLYRQAIDEAEAAIADDPGYVAAYTVLAGTRVGLADKLTISGGSDGPDANELLRAAIAEYRVYLDSKPDDYSAWWNLGWAAYLLGEPATSIEATDRAIALRPSEFALYLNRSLARLELGDDVGAMADVDRALELAAADTSDTAQWYLGQSDYDLGRLAALRSQHAPFLLGTQLRLREALVALRVLGRAVPDADAPALESVVVRTIDIGRYAGGRIEEGPPVEAGSHVETTAAVGVRVILGGELDGRTVSARVWIDDLPRPEYMVDLDVDGHGGSIDLMSPYGRAGSDLDPGHYALELYVDGSRRHELEWIVDPRPAAPQFATGAAALLQALRADGFDCPAGVPADGSTRVSCTGRFGVERHYWVDVYHDHLDRVTYLTMTTRTSGADDPVAEAASGFFVYVIRLLYPADLAARGAAWVRQQGTVVNDLELGGATLRVFGATETDRSLDIWAPWPQEEGT